MLVVDRQGSSGSRWDLVQKGSRLPLCFLASRVWKSILGLIWNCQALYQTYESRAGSGTSGPAPARSRPVASGTGLALNGCCASVSCSPEMASLSEALCSATQCPVAARSRCEFAAAVTCEAWSNPDRVWDEGWGGGGVRWPCLPATASPDTQNTTIGNIPVNHEPWIF